MPISLADDYNTLRMKHVRCMELLQTALDENSLLKMNAKEMNLKLSMVQLPDPAIADSLKTELRKLRIESTEREKREAGLFDEIKALKAQLERAEGAAKTTEGKFEEALKQEALAWENKLEAVNKEKDTLSAGLAAYADRTREYEAKLSEGKAEQARLEQQLAKSEEEVKRLAGDNVSKEEADRLRAEAGRAKELLDGTRIAVQEERKEYATKLSDAEGRLASMNGLMERMEAENALLRDKYARMEAELAALRKQKPDMRGGGNFKEFVKLKAEVQRLNEELRSLRKPPRGGSKVGQARGDRVLIRRPESSPRGSPRTAAQFGASSGRVARSPIRGPSGAGGLPVIR